MQDPAMGQPEESMEDMDMQDPGAGMTDDDIAASLGFATTLSQLVLPQDDMETEEDEDIETADESIDTEDVAEMDTEELEDTEDTGSEEVSEEDKDEEILRLKAEIYDLKRGEETSPE